MELDEDDEDDERWYCVDADDVNERLDFLSFLPKEVGNRLRSADDSSSCEAAASAT